MARPAKTICEKHNIPRVFFPRIRNGILGRESYCKECDRLKAHKYKHRQKEYRRKWMLESNGKSTTKNSFLLRTYGITLNDLIVLKEKQKYRCAICDKHESEIKGGLHVDHIHGTKIVRGLLCGRCNKGCGLFEENPETVLKAASYIALGGN